MYTVSRADLRFAVFPGAWLASLAAVFSLQTQAGGGTQFVAMLFGNMACGAIGIFTFAMSRSWRGTRMITNLVLLPIVFLGGSALLNVGQSVYYDVLWDNATSCNAIEVNSLVSEDVWHFTSTKGTRVATLRRQFCGYGFGQSRNAFYLSLRHRSAGDEHDNIALAYDTTEKGWSRPPKIRWLSDTSLKVTTESGDIDQVNVLKRDVDGAAISYALGGAGDQYVNSSSLPKRIWSHILFLIHSPELWFL